MRKLKHLYMTAVLTLALSITAFGGDMQTPGVASPPPTIQTSGTTNSDETSNSNVATKDSVTEIAMYLFDSMVYMLF